MKPLDLDTDALPLTEQLSCKTQGAATRILVYETWIRAIDTLRISQLLTTAEVNRVRLKLRKVLQKEIATKEMRLTNEGD